VAFAKNQRTGSVKDASSSSLSGRSAESMKVAYRKLSKDNDALRKKVEVLEQKLANRERKAERKERGKIEIKYTYPQKVAAMLEGHPKREWNYLLAKLAKIKGSGVKKKKDD